MTKHVAVILGLVFGCAKGKPAVRETEMHELSSIRFAAPKGSVYQDTGTVNSPAVTISGERYHVVIEKEIMKMTLASWKAAVEEEPGASNVVGTPTARGWQVKNSSSITAGADSVTVYVEYIEVGDDPYECRYDDEDSDVAIADAICRSISKK